MESSLLEALVTGGPVAILAFIIFCMYRRDRCNSEKLIAEMKVDTEKMWRDSKKFTEDRLTGIIVRDIETREDHTKVMTELIILLRNINGNRKL